MVAMDAPAGLRAYLHASRANGLWLALDVTTPAAQRDTFLKLLADFATQIRVVVEERKVPPHDRGVVLAWWRAARAEALRKEAAGGVGLRIGQIEETSVRRLDPGPSTAEERGARTTADTSPDPALVDFAGVLMDRARIMASQALASVPDQRLPAPGEPAPPSIPPMLSMRTGADTWTVFFWDDETPESMEAARDLIAEHGPVDMAAFVCDIVLNVGGDRTDALSVRVQGRGDDGSHWFVQRYVPRRRGQSFALSGRWALVRREEPIYPSDTPAASAAVRPSERAIASAHASIADMITFITFEDPSGARKLHRDDDEDEDGKSDNDESRPLLSPRLALEGADADQPARFIVFGLMGAAAGRLSAARAAQDEPDARIAAFRYDHVRLKNGAPHRELRVVVHERGTPQAFLFAQGYKVSKDTAFTTTGEIRLVGPVAPLFAD